MPFCCCYSTVNSAAVNRSFNGAFQLQISAHNINEKANDQRGKHTTAHVEIKPLESTYFSSVEYVKEMIGCHGDLMCFLWHYEIRVYWQFLHFCFTDNLWPERLFVCVLMCGEERTIISHRINQSCLAERRFHLHQQVTELLKDTPV